MTFGIVSPQVFDSAVSLRDRFARAQPFPHAVVDGFFADEFARELVEQFPAAGAGGSINPYGAPGKKAFHRNLKVLGSAYRTADACFSSRQFLDFIGEVTGIGSLLYDPSNLGGGTHENFEGRDLRPHVDFNYHPVTRLHRRLNLIVYLNPGWQPEWGGSIALHRDPRDPLNEAVEYAPVFNRCILFETSERSWHGFDRIRLPDGEKHRSRKSLSIYLYTRERPQHEVYKEHTTFFIPRPLPARFSEGYTLRAADELEIGELIGQRDRLIELYQHRQGRQEADSVQAARLRMTLAQIGAHHALPVMGYVRIMSGVSGLHPDGWSGSELRFTVRAERAVRGLQVRAAMPEGCSPSAVLTIAVDGRVCAASPPGAGVKELFAEISAAAGAETEIAITGPSEGFFLEQLIFEHTTE